MFNDSRDPIDFIKKHPANSLFILLNTFALIVTILTGGFNENNLYRLGAIEAPSIAYGQYYRLLYAMFLHGSILHYLMNTLFGLAIIGASLERIIGPIKYFLVYIFSGLVSSYFVYLTSEPKQLTIGASGAIYGILGVFLFIILLKKRMMSYSSRVMIRNLIIINVIFTFVAPSISIIGHLGGFLAGFIISPLLMIRQPDQFY